MGREMKLEADQVVSLFKRVRFVNHSNSVIQILEPDGKSSGPPVLISSTAADPWFSVETFDTIQARSATLLSAILSVSAAMWKPETSRALEQRCRIRLSCEPFDGGNDIDVVRALCILMCWDGSGLSVIPVRLGLAIGAAYKLRLHEIRCCTNEESSETDQSAAVSPLGAGIRSLLRSSGFALSLATRRLPGELGNASSS
jgi:hypothetical protein